jgi:hypothetical protein
MATWPGAVPVVAVASLARGLAVDSPFTSNGAPASTVVVVTGAATGIMVLVVPVVVVVVFGGGVVFDHVPSDCFQALFHDRMRNMIFDETLSIGPSPDESVAP